MPHKLGSISRAILGPYGATRPGDFWAIARQKHIDKSQTPWYPVNRERCLVRKGRVQLCKEIEKVRAGLLELC
jgi:hypothetical protein